MRDQLFALYQKNHEKFKSIRRSHAAEVLVGPHLLAPPTSYKYQKNPLLIIGQNTGSWLDDVEDLKRQMDTTEEFNVGKGYFSSPFWNVTRKVESALGNEDYSTAWTNVSKFALGKGQVDGRLAASIAKVDHILVDEIAIVSPKVCLFYTGPELDTRVCTIFDGINFDTLGGYDNKLLVRLVHPALPHHSYRTYHPGYLRRAKLEQRLVDFMETTVA